MQDLCNTLKREGLSEDDISLVKSVVEEREKGNSPPDNLRNVNRKILKKHAAEIKRILKYIPTKDITEMNSLLLAAGRVVQMKVGIKRSDNGKVQEPVAVLGIAGPEVICRALFESILDFFSIFS